MKFECKVCVESCLLDMGDSSVIPEECPIGIDAVDWHKVTEPAALPKLTVEALAERGIEWPEWAEFVVVSPSEWGLFASKVPALSVDKAYWIGGGLTLSIASCKWDATDWQNSKIMRPAKATCSAEHEDFPAGESKLELEENRFTLDGVEYEAVEGEADIDHGCALCDFRGPKCCKVKRPCCVASMRSDKRNVYFRKVKQLPDWLKLGAWAAVGNFVGKVDWLSRDGSECRITCGESRLAKTGEVKPVTWRAWNDDEMKQQVGTRFKSLEYNHVLLATECGCRPDGSKTILFIGAGGNNYHNSKDMIKRYEQLSGLPCGVPQVDGADLEG